MILPVIQMDSHHVFDPVAREKLPGIHLLYHVITLQVPMHALPWFRHCIFWFLAETGVSLELTQSRSFNLAPVPDVSHSA